MASEPKREDGNTTAKPSQEEQASNTHFRRPKKLIFAPGDIQAPPDFLRTSEAPEPVSSAAPPQQPSTSTAQARLVVPNPSILRPEISGSSTPTSVAEGHMISHPARAHQFVTNPPLTISQIHPTSPLRQFHRWFRDPRLPASAAPETCTLATAAMPSGRVSARVVYLKELDECGWVVYSNWGSLEGKGGQVFGSYYADGAESDAQTPGAMPSPEQAAARDGTGTGNKWAALTFSWASVERQVRIEGLLEPLTREESELYWRTRERGSQIGAWASWQSKVLWSAEPGSLVRSGQADGGLGLASSSAAAAAGAEFAVVPGDRDNLYETDMDDGRAVLEQRTKEMEARFAGVLEIPLPPFWGGVRLVPESVEFWQGRRSRLHDRFRYVRVPEDTGETRRVPRQQSEGDPLFEWRIERLSP